MISQLFYVAIAYRHLGSLGKMDYIAMPIDEALWRRRYRHGPQSADRCPRGPGYHARVTSANTSAPPLSGSSASTFAPARMAAPRTYPVSAKRLNRE